jgi:hypothetical protein
MNELPVAAPAAAPTAVSGQPTSRNNGPKARYRQQAKSSKKAGRATYACANAGALPGAFGAIVEGFRGHASRQHPKARPAQ